MIYIHLRVQNILSCGTNDWKTGGLEVSVSFICLESCLNCFLLTNTLNTIYKDMILSLCKTLIKWTIFISRATINIIFGGLALWGQMQILVVDLGDKASPWLPLVAPSPFKSFSCQTKTSILVLQSRHFIDVEFYMHYSDRH